MKNLAQYLILLLSLNIVCSINVHAQKNTVKIDYVDVLHLKNGEKIRGTIVYQVPKVRVSISVHDKKTETDKVYTYQMTEIVKIVKERADGKSTSELGISGNNPSQLPSKKQSFGDGSLSLNLMEQKPQMMEFKPVVKPTEGNVPKPTYSEKPTIGEGEKGGIDEVDYTDFRQFRQKGIGWNRKIKGIRVLSDYAYTNGIGSLKNNRFDWATSIGYQNDPIFYLGFGLSYSMTLDKDRESSLPIFINPHVNFLDEDITPYFDFKIGYSLMEAKGWYYSPSVGVSFVLSGTKAINIGVGYSYQQAKYKKPNEEGVKVRMNQKYTGIYLKVTYEFNVFSF